MRRVRIGMLGFGRVGRAVVDEARRPRSPWVNRGLHVDCVGALVRRRLAHRPPTDVQLTTSARTLLGTVPDVVVEVMGGVEPARALVAAALRAGIPVVTANKSLIARHGPALVALARSRGVALAFDATVVAGVPFLGSLAHRPGLANIRRMAGILNGTSHYVLTEMANGQSLARALGRAIELGFAEPHADADVSGRDAAEKLAILLQLAGIDVAAGDVFRRGIDGLEPADFAGARLLGGTVKPVAVAACGRDVHAWVGPAFVPAGHAFARLTGIDNAVQLESRTGNVVTFAGPGAGPAVTAATILDDVAELCERGPCAPANAATGRRPLPSRHRRWRQPEGRWFLRVSKDADASACRTATWLDELDVPYDRIVAGRSAVYAITKPVPWASITKVVERARSLGTQAIALLSL